MTSIYFHELVLRVTTLFKIMIVLLIVASSVKIFNISRTNVLSSFYIVFILLVSIFQIFVKIYSALIVYVNNITNIFDNNLYITGLFNRDNKFLC